MNKSTSTLPSIFTLLNLSLGVLSILYTIQGNFLIGAFSILLATLSDSLDGFVARKIRAESTFGKELDSLADLTSFGIAPSILIYLKYFSPILPTSIYLHVWGVLITMFFPICGAIRLARFNISPPSQNFTGLPIPAAGGFLAALSLSYPKLKSTFFLIPNICLTFIILSLSILMVSNLTYPKYKRKDLSSKGKSRLYLLFLSCLLPLFNYKLLFLPFLLYILFGII